MHGSSSDGSSGWIIWLVLLCCLGLLEILVILVLLDIMVIMVGCSGAYLAVVSHGQRRRLALGLRRLLLRHERRVLRLRDHSVAAQGSSNRPISVFSLEVECQHEVAGKASALSAGTRCRLNANTELQDLDRQRCNVRRTHIQSGRQSVRARRGKRYTEISLLQLHAQKPITVNLHSTCTALPRSLPSPP